MTLTKVVWYVLNVKNMHPGSPSHPSGTAAAEANPRCVYLILKPHGQSFITSPESVQSGCVRQHTQEVPAQRVLPSDIYFIFKSGDEEVIEDCNEKICPSPGQWSEWGECSKSCGGGTRTKTRECINQRDSYGNPCNQDLVETEKCNENPCPIWTDWTDWTPCTVTCGGGTRKKARECVLPKSEAQVSKN